MRLICFEFKAFEQYQQLITTDRRLALKIGDLINNISRTPFTGIGKPEALKGNFQGYWSRRINDQQGLHTRLLMIGLL